MSEKKLPRASLTQKIEVLDYFRGKPQRTQKDVLDKYQKQGQFAISQATLSSWILNETALRKTFNDNPNLLNYKKNPVLKYPEVMKAVEDDIEQRARKGLTITDQTIKDCFQYYARIYGYDKNIQFSTGMLHSFKKRNNIRKGKMQLQAIFDAGSPREDNIASVSVVPNPDINNDTLNQAAISAEIMPQSGLEPDLAQPDHVSELLASSSLGFNTKLIHSDDSYSNIFNILGMNGGETNDIGKTAHPMSLVSADDDQEILAERTDDRLLTSRRQNYTIENFSYSRTTHPNSEKVEKILENITNGYVTLYNSGTSAIMGLLTFVNCRKIAINTNGYQGTHQVIKLLHKLTGVQKLSLAEFDRLGPNDIMIIESPMNPEGYCVDIEKYSRLAHSKGALLAVDSTLAPPPLQDPFVQGADYIIHSATKYFSGHSDLLAGFIVSKTQEQKRKLMEERFSLGTNIANFDSFLLLRSLRTFKMRILQQCSNTFHLIKFLVRNIAEYPVVVKIHHSSLQSDPFVVRQLNGYYNPVFAIEVSSMQIAKLLMTRFKFVTSKRNVSGGGGETSVELANINPVFVSLDAAESDSLRSFGIRGNILRFSIGCEDYEDLVRDVDQALKSCHSG